MKKQFTIILLSILVLFISNKYSEAEILEKNEYRQISTFSIVARDSINGELGIAVASRFFAVGNVVPWAQADVGAIATQSFANTSFGWRGLELLEMGLNPEEIVEILLRADDNPNKRQFGIVASDGSSATYTGANCIAWAGGRNGRHYAIQGNILAGEAVVLGMEKIFLETNGSLAERLYAALLEGDRNGGDSRGKQSAALIIVKEGAGYGGYTDLAIDIRVDDHLEPFKELGRLLNIAQMNYAWNEGWTWFTQKKYTAALPFLEKAAKLGPENAEVQYDLAVIRLALGKERKALEALDSAIKLNPKLKKQAIADKDLESLKNTTEFKNLIKK